MRALKDGGILSVTLWNKEEPPKSVLKLYATMAEAARQVDGGAIADRFFVVSSYLSTATVLYKRGGFTPAEIDQAARAHPRHVVRRDLLSGLRLRRQGRRVRPQRLPQLDLPRWADGGSVRCRPDASKPGEGPPADSGTLPATTMGQMAWHHLVHGGWDDVARQATCSTRACSPTTGPISRPT